jgi:outer membrane receptor protein involved in Fe transport
MMRHLNKILITACFLLFTAISAFGQTVAGHVYDAETEEALIGVNVFYREKDSMDGVTTDEKGFYEINVPNGGTVLNFSYIGYEPQLQPVVVRRNQTVTLDVRLKQYTEMMEEVVVSAGRFDQKLSEITVSMEIIKPENIVRQNATDLSKVLNTLPGVDVVDKQPSIRGGSGWTYGVGSRCQVMVDGMSVLTPGVGEINWNTIPMENVAQVEVIKGASSVLYGSSALNGLINVRTARPESEPQTTVDTYLGIYMDPGNKDYIWWDKEFWRDGKIQVKPALRQNLLYGIRNPIYTSTDISHTRRIGNFDVSGGIDMHTNEGFRQGDYNRRIRFGGNVTYHDPKIYGLNYGININYLTNDYGGFFIWRSADQPYMKSAMANMSRQGNSFYIDPFINYANTEKGITHRLKGRYYYKSDQIFSNPTDKSITDITASMGFDFAKAPELIEMLQDPLNNLLPSDWLQRILIDQDYIGIIRDVEGKLKPYFPGAKAPDIVDLLSWVMSRTPLPSFQSDPILWVPWLLNANNPQNNNSTADNTNSYYLDYQYGRKIGSANVTVGSTFEHVDMKSSVTGAHSSDNIAAFVQYDHKLFEKLNLSLGMRLEYYRVDSLTREAETNIFGWKAPFKPVFRGGLNYQLAEATYLRASFGQGYRYPSLTEKYVYKDIGGLAAYPNRALKPESGYNAELGIKQGYKFGNFMGFIDVAGFYTVYKDMIEFQFGLFNSTTYAYVDNLSELIGMFTRGETPGLGTRFSNVENAHISGLDLSVNGLWNINPATKLTYSLGYVFINPVDPDWKKKNAKESDNTDPLAMKEKSNDSKYFKYRQKHSVKGVFDIQWNRLTVGANMTCKSKTLAVDYFMVDERAKDREDIMDIVRSVIFPGLHDYWMEHNKGYFAMDARLGIRVSKEIQFWLMFNNLLNTEYSLRPMDVSPPRTMIFQINMKL